MLNGAHSKLRDGKISICLTRVGKAKGNLKESEASRSTSSGGSLTSIQQNSGENSNNEETKRSKHANYRDMVNYEALEVS